jgi:hypothetical protein
VDQQDQAAQVVQQDQQVLEVLEGQEGQVVQVVVAAEDLVEVRPDRQFLFLLVVVAVAAPELLLEEVDGAGPPLVSFSFRFQVLLETRMAAEAAAVGSDTRNSQYTVVMVED